jgi:tetratricopeptide (TPR) repeat protein
MRSLWCACLLLPLAAAATSAADLKDARLRWLKGNYEEAQADYEELLKNARLRSPASVGLSKALASQGEYDKALAVVNKALAALPKDADLLARKAELLHLRGRWDEADKAADAALAVQDTHLLARWVKAQLYRDRGQTDKAEAEVKRIMRFYGARVDTPQEIKDPEELLIVGLASAENARWNAIADEFQVILKDLYGDAIKNDKAFWPAELQAGLLLLEKYNRVEATEAFDKALTINPNAAEALTAKGVEALMRYEIKAAENYAERALKTNPLLPEALRLRADVYLAVGDTAKAAKELQQALTVSPRDERTLARLAACSTLDNDQKAVDALAARVEKFDARPALFYYELGDRLEERRRFDRAEKYLREAARLRPKMPGPLNSLGLLYMRMGKEAEASTVLERAFKADAFNVRVKNMRKVLNHLSKYSAIKTKHFTVMHDPKTDAALARVMADYLETIYADLAKKFDYQPEGPILVEVFRTHQMFSGRTVALPDLHTIGACTGRVITLCSPNEKDSKGEPARTPFNWARVLRHEAVHIFNLAQTHYLVPHWFTEGLAVSNEGFPRPAPWNRMLLERVPAGKLLNLDSIDLGFIRPRDAMEWQQAYCQAQLYIDYIRKEYGPAAVGKLLAAFGRGLSAVAALKEVCKVEKADFEKGYRAYLDQVVKELGGKRAAEKKRTLAQLRAEYKKNPRDAETAGELALRLLNAGKRAEARKIAEAAVEEKKDQPRANYVLAMLARRAEDVKQEKRLLERALDRKNPDTLVLKALGKLYYDASTFDSAAEMFELGRKAEPFERDWLQELARVYAQTNDKAKQIAVLKDLVPTDADDFDRRARLARLLLESGKNADAEKYAREALEIDVTSKQARETLYKALQAQDKAAELKRMRGLLEAGKGE